MLPSWVAGAGAEHPPDPVQSPGTSHWLRCILADGQVLGAAADTAAVQAAEAVTAIVPQLAALYNIAAADLQTKMPSRGRNASVETGRWVCYVLLTDSHGKNVKVRKRYGAEAGDSFTAACAADLDAWLYTAGQGCCDLEGATYWLEAHHKPLLAGLSS